MKKDNGQRRSLLTGASIFAAAAATVMSGGTALAQPQPQPQQAQQTDDEEEIVVTGTILRGNANSVSPLGVVSAEAMDQRGQTTISDVVQTLSGNNAGQLPNSFSANGAFASGASGASLRGLLVSNTLVLVDGLRPAYYPLADDATRNFVDLNTIPQNIVERVEVLKDGASSTYGADAIAGVINVITRREFQGLEIDAATGWSEAGGAEQNYLSGIWGFGDLASDGFNFYAGFEYQTDEMLMNRERGFPFNTGDLSSICTTSDLGPFTTCDANNNPNGLQYDGLFLGVGTTPNATVRSRNATDTGYTGDWVMLNPTCAFGDPVTRTAAQIAPPGTPASFGIGNVGPVNLCEVDNIAEFGVISPESDRFSFSGRFTFSLGANAEAYMMGNYYQNDVFFTGTPSNIRAATTPGASGIVVRTNGATGPGFGQNAEIRLPVWVCGAGSYTYQCDGTEADAVLNPNNPYAAAGRDARIVYRFGAIDQWTRNFSQTFRAAGGIGGTADLQGREYRYNLDMSAMQTNLEVTQAGRLWFPALWQVVRQGTYNFINPEANSDAINSLVSPTNVQNSDSKLIMIQGTVSTDLFELGGGMAELGVSVQGRYEALNNPSANPDNKGPEQRYFTINPFGASGSRDTQSVAFETLLPFTDMLDVTVSGRYDIYSTGQSDFSPKIGARFSPFDFLTFRGTYSEGFRIPSFAESFADPSTGFITVSAPTGAGSWCDVNHGAPAAAYCGPYGLGLTQVADPNLQPEESQNMNLGIVLRPFDRWTFSADYYRIQMDNVIGGADPGPAIAAYYAGTPIPAGFTIVPDEPNPLFPASPPRAAFVIYSLQNLGTRDTNGWDFQINGGAMLGPLDWSMALEATYLDSYTQEFPGGGEQEYAGTIGPYIITSASGTPQWRGSWQNTFAWGPASLTLTAYYTEGYLSSAEDVGGDAEDCNTDPVHHYRDGVTAVVCKVDDSIFLDANVTYDLNDNFQFYLDVSNVLDEDPAFDPTTYGAWQYNPAWGTPGIIGRYFTLGARATF
jgi:iron complex outermembrane receptor protein